MTVTALAFYGKSKNLKSTTRKVVVLITPWARCRCCCWFWKVHMYGSQSWAHICYYFMAKVAMHWSWAKNIKDPLQNCSNLKQLSRRKSVPTPNRIDNATEDKTKNNNISHCSWMNLLKKSSISLCESLSFLLLLFTSIHLSHFGRSPQRLSFHQWVIDCLCMLWFSSVLLFYRVTKVLLFSFYSLSLRFVQWKSINDFTDVQWKYIAYLWNSSRSLPIAARCNGIIWICIIRSNFMNSQRQCLCHGSCDATMWFTTKTKKNF